MVPHRAAIAAAGSCRLFDSQDPADRRNRDLPSVGPLLRCPGRNSAKENRMTKFLIMAACLGFGVSAAGACEYLRSAKADTDTTVVASVVTDEQSPCPRP